MNGMTKSDVNAAFIEACGLGDSEIVRYFLSNSALLLAGLNADIHTGEDIAVRYACKYGRLEVLKYLLDSPDLVEHGNIHAKDDYAFRWACLNGHHDIVHYLIFDKGIKQTEHIDFFLNNPNEPYDAKKLAWDMFRTRANKPKLYIITKNVK